MKYVNEIEFNSETDKWTCTTCHEEHDKQVDAIQCRNDEY